jgi:hypothetical protein
MTLLAGEVQMMASARSSLGIMLKWIAIIAIPHKDRLVLLTKRPKFGKTFGKQRFHQNKLISFDVFFIMLSLSNSNSSLKESCMTVSALDATKKLKPLTMFPTL